MKGTSFVFLSACLGLLLFGISLITLGSVATGLQEKFHLDQVSSGSLFSILPIGILAGSFLFGPFADRYGYKIIMVLSCLCMFAGFQGIAYASSLNLLRVCIFLFGLGGGAINGASNAVVSDISKTNKGANLSLLGISFAVGALGMPFILGTLERKYSFQALVSAVGYLPLFVSILFMITQFPEPKQTQGVPISRGMKLLFRDNVLILIGFFLFCQSSFEAIINNWTTTYLAHTLSISGSKSLYALSLYVAGMAAMRLITGSLLRNTSAWGILWLSFASLLGGTMVLHFATSYGVAVTGLVLIGIGLAAGFPVMLGFVGNRYADLSGTAFSLVISIALIGNMTVNFLMGLIAERYGIEHLTTVSFILLVLMTVLTLTVRKKLNFTT